MKPRITLTPRLVGTKQAYWVLQIFVGNAELPVKVHTGKGKAGLRYLQSIAARERKMEYSLPNEQSELQ